jgi:GDP-L-fucose synthase
MPASAGVGPNCPMPAGKVWITGGTGFLGRALAQRLGARALPTGRRQADLLQEDVVERFLDEHPVEAIVHAAGFVGGVQLMQAQPQRMFEENLLMGRNVVEHAARRNLPLILIGSAAAYPNDAPIPTPETELLAGEPSGGAYGRAKRALIVLALERGGPFVYLALTSLYGPGDHFDEGRSTVAAALVRRAFEAKREGRKELTVWGDGSATRDFLFVEDAARAVELALERFPAGEAVNVGSGRETAIRELAEAVCLATGFEGEIAWDPAQPVGAPRRCLDPKKAKRLLAFEAEVSLAEGLWRTAEWYAANHKA